MPVADIIRLGNVRLTHQQIADMMLSEDRARRRALKRGDDSAAEQHDAELRQLGTLLDAA